jgi:hypothetical protein
MSNINSTLLFLSSFSADLEDERINDLTMFLITENISLAPEPQDLNLLIDKYMSVSNLLTFLSMTGTNFIFSKKNVKGQLHSVDYSFYNLYTDEDEEVDALDLTHEQLKSMKTVKLTDLADHVLGEVAENLGKLEPKKLAKFFSLLAYGIDVEDTKVSFAANYGGLEIDFNTGEFSVGRTHKVAANLVSIGTRDVSSLGVLFLLGAEIVQLGTSGMWRGEGILNKVPGLWDEDHNYGVKTKDANMYLAKGGKKTVKFDIHKNRNVFAFPYFALANGKFKVEGTTFEGKTIFTDKTANKTKYDDDAANAAGIFGATVQFISKSGEVKSQKGQFTINDTGAKMVDGVLKEIMAINIGAKVLNRITQAFKSLSADLNKWDNGKLVSIRNSSKFGTKIMSTGAKCLMEGQLVKVAMTNSTLCRGSGVALCNPEFWFIYGVDEKLKGRVNYNELTGEALAKYAAVPTKEHGNFFMFLKDVGDVLDAIPKDKVFGPGDVIAEFDFGGKKPHVLFNNKSHNKYFMVTGYTVKQPKITKKDYRPSYSDIVLNVKAVKKTQFAKLRSAGIKATTVVDLNDQWFNLNGDKVGYPADIIFNNETRKGQLSNLLMFAHSDDNIKDAVVEGDDSGCYTVVTYTNGKADKRINLMDPFNEVTQWVNANTTVMKLQSSMPKYEYEKSLKAAESAKFELSWKLIQDNGDWVVVEDEVEVLVGYMPLNYEISTADDSVTASTLTPEMMAGTSLLSQEFVEAVYAEAKPTRDVLFGLLNMATGTMLDNTVEINLQLPQELKAMQELVGDLSGMSDRHVVDVMSKHYPDGIMFYASGVGGNSQLLVDFKVVGATMTFIEGSADQISQEIVSAVKYFSSAEKTNTSGIDSTMYSMICQLSGSLKAWIIEGLTSKGIIKKLSRSSKCLINCKVRTVYDLALIPDADGVPKILVHPDCGVAKMLGQNVDKSWNPSYLSNYLYADKKSFKNKFSVDFPHAKFVSMEKNDSGTGYIVTFFDPYMLNGVIAPTVRIPMFMPAVCKIVISEVLEPSYIGLLPSVWAEGNSGDSDGDGVGAMNGSARGMTVADAVRMNKSVAGMAGYNTIYANTKMPFADFLEKPSKKNLLQPKGFAYASFLPHDDVEEFAFNPEYSHVGLRGTHVNTANHYMYSVGTGYGIASAVTCWAAVCALNPKWSNKMPLLEKAILVIWTLVYEGLGLSGYSATAAKFFDVLRVSSFGIGKDKDGNHQYQYAIDKDGNPVPTFSDVAKEQKLEANDAVAFMLNALDLPEDDDWISVLEVLIDFNNFRMKYGKLDRNQITPEKLEKWSDHDLARITMVGMFRHMGRGVDPATGIEIEAAESGDLYGADFPSSFKLVENRGYINQFLPQGTWLNKMYTNGMNFMLEANETLLDNAQETAFRNQNGQ